MRKAILVLVVLAMSSTAMARSVSVRGHIRSDGTYVAPHVRSAPDNTTINNWSTAPNINPYTGQAGKRDAFPEYRPYQPTTPRASTYPSAPAYKTPCYFNCK